MCAGGLSKHNAEVLTMVPASPTIVVDQVSPGTAPTGPKSTKS